MSYSRLYYTVRPLVLFAHSNKCHICQTSNEKIEVHHIDKNKQNNSVWNLVPLCKTHHEFAHKFQLQFSGKYHENIEFQLLVFDEFLKQHFKGYSK